MSKDFYLPRTLLEVSETYSEAQLLVGPRFIVVLAEPGGGKTSLMESLGRQLKTPVLTANRFIHTGVVGKGAPLVIDAYDELAKVDASGIDKLLASALSADPSKLLISSRSSEWGNSANRAFQDFFGETPLVVRLSEFTVDEQKRIFENYIPSEDFEAFQSEVARFDLEAILPNPQFLKLFADAYIESGRKFSDKRSIFQQALERLAKEANASVRRTAGSLPAGQKVQEASEVFAKLLMSGAEGVTTSEANEDALYPLMDTLVADAGSKQTILATRMFKPGEIVDTHRPVHKIIAEFAAADYLTKRIADPSDALTLGRSLPIIAPNSTVRDELRGLVGWMASLGNKPIQEAAIDLDAYAVLANGDPSQLASTSKRRLVRRLKDVEDQDPYFRRGDFWRRFSVAGLFSAEVVDEVRPHLSPQSDGQFRDLILELLEGSPATAQLSVELSALCLSTEANEHTRVMAATLLLATPGFIHNANLAQLIFQADPVSMKVAAKIIQQLGVSQFSNSYLTGYLRVFANLYPRARRSSERFIGARYFLRNLIETLDCKQTTDLLDSLSVDLTCKCGQKAHDCHCRNGISKIIGLLLDHYCEVSDKPHDPKRFWGWVKKLNFHSSMSPDRSASVRLLRDNDDLRQGIMQIALGHETDAERIREIRFEQFEWQSHSGLHFQPNDWEFMADLAFDRDNVALWSEFLAAHNYHREPEQRGPDKLRKKMRMQAKEKRIFLEEWSKRNRNYQQMMRERRERRYWSERRWKRRDKAVADANQASLLRDRQLIENGRHWPWLYRIACLYLIQPHDLEEELGGRVDHEKALRNCFDFLAEYVPSLKDVALGNWHNVARVLHAACIAEFRATGEISHISKETLEIVKTDLGNYQGVSEDEAKAFETAIDAKIFPSMADVESFLRRYVEPQLAQGTKGHTNSSWLGYKEEFHPLRAKLSIDWLARYRALPFHTLDTLFNIAAGFADRERLKELVLERCAEFMFFWPNQTEDEELEQRRKFWFLRALYFIPALPDVYFDWLAADKDTVLAIYERSGRGNRIDYEAWPSLTSCKVEAILDAFIGVWPKVPLPNSYVSDSPKGEVAYRCLTELVWTISSDHPDAAIPVLRRLIADSRYADIVKDLKSIRSAQTRKKALADFTPPTPQQIVEMLDHGAVVTVDGLRKLVLHELSQLQAAIDGGEFDTAKLFYAGEDRLDEEPCTKIIAERLDLILRPQSITITPEHHLKHDKRCDFTAGKLLGSARRLLVTEVKGQWHPKLYEAASEQLNNLYAIHPDAEKQGIYLVLWFGENEKVAGRKRHGIKEPMELKRQLEAEIPLELRGLLDVFVLDISKK
ncbi:hypothetical protein [Salipiger abyssi]|uniref:Putative membrane protein n=1 Tax=Salipiger abyssi TaxID=1250539 RepID=A0A1P8UWW5_9RHOB|nr:hypothetical protein [Salipiger abyssi]APZ53826.1 Putative membrane protein [Salipiger abyssi]